MVDRRTRTAPAGLLIRVDVACLTASCASYARWHDEALARMADHDEHTGALLVKTAYGNVRRNPLVKIAADMLAFANQFGIPPSARVRLGSGGYGLSPPSKFGGG